MTLAGIDPRLRRVLALAILAALVSAAVELAVMPMLGWWHAAQVRLDDVEARRAMLAAAAARLPALEARLARAEAEARGRPGLLRAQSTALASAELQGRIQKIVAAAGGELRSIQPLIPRKEADIGAVRVGFRLRVSVLEGAAVGLLDEIARHDPVLTVEQITLTGGQQHPEGRDVDMQMDLDSLVVEEAR